MTARSRTVQSCLSPWPTWGQQGQREKAGDPPPGGNETTRLAHVLSARSQHAPTVTEPAPSPGQLPLLVALFPGKAFLDVLLSLFTQMAVSVVWLENGLSFKDSPGC